jgi:hypothetical protein
MIRNLRRQSMKVLLGLGLWAGMQGLVFAQYYPAETYGPVQYVPFVPFNPYPPYGPVGPYPPGGPMQLTALPAPPAQPLPPAPPVQPLNSSNNLPVESPEHDAGPHADMEKGCINTDLNGEPLSIAFIGMEGRGDFLNRLNLFDNMSALPTNRVWGGFETLNNFQTGFAGPQDPSLPLAQRRTENLYRGGAEISLGNMVSFIAQGEYVSSVGSTSNQDAWANPWFAVKWAAIYSETTVISPMLAFQPATSQEDGQLHDKSSRIYPGFLFFQNIGNTFFLQGGLQFGITTGLGSNTADYGLSLGMWLYRDGSIDVAGRRTDSFERTALPFCTGVIPQLELWGKNVISGASRPPIDPITPDLFETYTGFHEGENVYNMTVGCRFLFINHFSLGLGYSFPLTSVYVEKQEFETNLNVDF